MKTKFYAILLLAAMSVAACKKEPRSGGPGAEEQGTAKLTLKIKQAKGITTYTPDDPNATDEESIVNRIDVFIFDDGAPFGVIHRSVTAAADIYVDPLNKITSGLKPIELLNVKTGRKRVYVGINLTTAVVNRIADNYAFLTDGISFNTGTIAPYNTDQLFEHLVGTPLVPANNDANLVMFNTFDFDDAVPGNRNIIDITEAGPNPITVNVSRMLAKVAVKQDAALSLVVPGGTLSDLRFTAGRTNNRLHLAPLKNFIDGNWASFQSADFNLNAVDAVFQPYANGVIDPTDNDWATDFDFEAAATPKIYLPENTSELHRHNDVSFVSLRATFTPTDDGEPVGFGTTPTVTGAFPAGTFYAVFSNDPGAVLTPTPGMAIHYFPSTGEADADAFATAHSGVKITYTGGFCYYRIYLNASGNGTTTGNPYDVLRNVFYKVNITKINTIGNSHPDDIPGASGTPAFPGGSVVAENPEVLPTTVISPPVNADIETTVTIADWVSQPEDVEF
ncbi:Mfa1 family fimbria major subunit [Daejeonella sp. JGW-45]|uniref:Mfa1 family fimbria major subunit n=1 Tax=Daejeonella sp. JGW-45 TaxID=3034148 RepID=UPI0023EC058A|nr:Mfa1 family fimbria major subunit [Daejeonella sp. JGW-45]